MELLATVLAGFAIALLAPWIHRLARGATGWIMALVPLAILAFYASRAPAIAGGDILRQSMPWVPGLDVDLAFRLDGLSLVFVLLITGIGTLIMVYAGGYLKGDYQLGRFYLYILTFMASMLGAVLSDNLLTLFVFWELTSLSSYLLIGFSHDHAESRASALQALLVTGGGGLALLAGLLILGLVAGTVDITELLGQGDVVRASPLYGAILGLVLVGAFTKSAQFPFHFWLPGAMAAPTPVSAYLHSATMVKLGIYLLARLSPVLAGTEAWTFWVSGAGSITMVIGAYLALQQSDLKRVLAYSTVSALGTITLLLGIGSLLAVEAALVFLLAHALYKGALFMVAGAVDHETGTRNLDHLSGLRSAMPVTAVAAVLAALSLAGFAPLFSFIGKELLFEALLHADEPRFFLVVMVVIGSMLLVAVAGIVGLRPFFGELKETPKKPHEAPASMLLGPVVLASASLLLGPLPGLIEGWLVIPAVTAILREPVPAVELALWHGLNPMLLLSLLSILGGVAIYKEWIDLHRVVSPLERLMRWGPEAWYRAGLAGMLRFAGFQARVIQNGNLRSYVFATLTVTTVVTAWTLLSRHGLTWAPDLSGLRAYHVVILAILVIAAVATALARNRLTAVLALGVVGYSVALLYLLFGAPDLAITQLLIETLTVILFVLVLVKMPKLTPRSAPSTRLRDAALSIAFGALMTSLVLAATAVDVAPAISDFFARASFEEAHGRNVVNVILVDFRALDTLGEITVLGIAAVGVLALLTAIRSPKEGEDT